MKKTSRMRQCLTVTAALIFASVLLTPPLGHASDVARLSGSYQIVQKTADSAHTRVQLHLRLTNPGPRDLHIQRLTLWDSPHPERGGTQKCSLFLHAGASLNTTQEFTISRPNLDLWNRGTRPRLVLELLGSSGRVTTAVVRLDRASRGRAN